jgi:hypothetical protein
MKEPCHWPFGNHRCKELGTPREPTGLCYCDFHWQVVIDLRNNLQAYGEAKMMGRAVRIEQFF